MISLIVLLMMNLNCKKSKTVQYDLKKNSLVMHITNRKQLELIMDKQKINSFYNIHVGPN